MANLREIKKRIGSVSTTQQITRTMEMVATAKIARALQRAKNSEPYSAAITDVMLTVATDPALNVNSPLLVDPETYERALVIAISSDRGLAGGFNMQVERAAEQRIKYFRKYPCKVLGIVGESDDPTLENARVVANYVIDGFSQGRFGRVDIVYFHAKNRVEQVLRSERILPLDDEVLRTARGPRANEDEAPTRLASPFEFVPSAEHVLDKLIPSYVLTVVHQAMIDSAAAEQGARRKSMHSATENASAIIADLTRTYNRVRQASITTEINEIVGGAAALEEH